MASPDRFDDRRLREESLKAFVKALHTDRMVAVTGAMSTRALGYPSWDEFVKAYAIVAEKLAETIRNERENEPCLDVSPAGRLLADIIARARALRSDPYKKEDLDPRVPLWALHESFRALDTQMRQVRSGLVIDNVYQNPALFRFEKSVAAIFRSRTLGAGPLATHAAAAAVGPLIASLGIKRVATLNYDLELERAFMLRGDERQIMQEADRKAAHARGRPSRRADSKAEIFAAKIKEENLPMSSVEHFIGERESGKPILASHRHRLSRKMGNGVHVESDIVDRERPDRLFEFAVGSAETDRHILHLHGRADVPSSMVANIRQYDRLYRLDDLYRDPFDHSLRVLVGGNPILFIGVGMTETELNNTLQYFVSNVPVRRPAPTFVIWNTNDMPANEEKKRYMTDRRLDFRTRLGVHLLFDEDIVQLDDKWLSNLQTVSAAPDRTESSLLELYNLIDPSPRGKYHALEAACAQLEGGGEQTQPGTRKSRERVEASLLELYRLVDPSMNGWNGALIAARSNLRRFGKQGRREAKKLEAMATMLAKLPTLVSRVDRRINRKGRWRSARPRFDAEANKPCRILGATRVHQLIKDRQTKGQPPRVDLDAFRSPVANGSRSRSGNAATGQGAQIFSSQVPAAGAELRDIVRIGAVVVPSAGKDANLVFAAGPLGYGRGELAEHILQMPPRGLAIGEAVLLHTERDERLLINAGFSYDSDAMLNGIAQFLAKRLGLDRDGSICREQMFADGTLFKRRALIIINGAERFFGSDGTPLSAELDHMLRCARRGGSVQFLMLGTERLRHYCDAIGAVLHRLPANAMQGGASLHDEPGAKPAVLAVDAKAVEPPAVPAPGAQPPAGANAASLARAEPWMERTQLEKLDLVEDGRLGPRYLDFVASCFRTATRAARKSMFEKEKEEKNPRFKAAWARADISDAAAAHIGRAISIDRDALNRAFYEAYLSPALLQALDVDCPEAFEVLRTMCFIGAPVETAVLLHAPKVRAILAENSERKRKPGTDMRSRDAIRVRLQKVINRLHQLGLLVELDAYLGQEEKSGAAKGPRKSPARGRLWKRFGLHPSLAAFLRDRHGAPINDAKLATAFNMSLFMSDPSDNYTPEPDFHDELGELVDSLIGGWHDIERIYGDQGDSLLEGRQRKDYESALSDLYVHPWDSDHAWGTLKLRSSREASSCLRAALSLVRGYYSTGALLKLDRDDRLATAERDGALTEHAQRLDRLVTGFGDISIARNIVCDMLPSDAERVGHMGADPFYADDLVWLHNERGVVALAQGHMFDAREAFSAANAVNDSEVEFEYHGHNWRRIALNMVATRIERGTLKPAERLLEEIDGTINTARWCDDASRLGKADAGASRVELIRMLFRSPEKDPPIRGDADHLREEMLVVAMTTSYRGLIAHIRGRYHEAKEALGNGIDILRRLGEQRAYAHFQRHYAMLLSFGGDKPRAAREIDHAINAAQSAKQMDILHRARVVRANLSRSISTDPTVRRHALQDIKDALKYAALSDCYRVRIEASASLARHMRHGGDYDTALRYATDALTIASRYGHSLQKTLLRIEIGQILRARGDPISGEALLTKAIAIGTSKGYHQALEHVRRARIALETNPPMPNRTDISITP